MEIVTTVAALIFALIDARSGAALPADTVAQELARRDVVFFGEEHDNDAGHKVHRELLEAVHRIRPDTVLSMEMFERDVQGVLDDYLAGRIDEETFLAHARPWPNYKAHYRPLVEYARENGLQVIAANTPRKVAGRVSRDGVDAIATVFGAARSTTAPKDQYFDLFKKAMNEAPGHGFEGEMLDRFYAAQCVKDDTMAESIADFFAQHPARTPLVVHVCGKFHSDFGLGTVTRLASRRPLLQISVLTMNPAKDPRTWKPGPKEKGVAHFHLVVPEQPKKEAKVEAKAAASDSAPAVEAKDTHPAAMANPHEAKAVAQDVIGEVTTIKVSPSQPVAVDVTGTKPIKTPHGKTAPAPHGKPSVDEKPFKFDVNGSPALGIMPDYDASKKGVRVGGVVEGGAASRAQLLEGDMITAVDGREVSNIQDYMDVMADLKPGDKIRVKVTRDGKDVTKTVTLGSR